jgi:hypothetical protein
MAASLSACSSETSALVDVLPGDVPEPSSLVVTAFGAGRIGVAHTLPVTTLPGTIGLRHLDPPPPNFRVLVEALAGAQRVGVAAARRDLVPGAEVRMDLTLVASLPDGDGDGIPDAIDDCPDVPDPAQDCAGEPDGAAPIDLAVDAPPPDLASPDATIDLAGDQAPTGRCPPGSLFCEDFETIGQTGNYGQWTPVLVGATAMATVDVKPSPPPLGGQYSLHTTLTPSSASNEAALEHTITPLAANELLATRFYLWVQPTTGATTADVIWPHVRTSSAGWIVSYGGMGSSFQLSMNKVGSLSAAVPVAQWLCLEIDIDNSQSGAATVYMGDVATTPRGTGNGPIPVDTLQFGLIGTYQTTDFVELYVDDIVVAKQHIGCEP